jgi:Family of unknown function (DUF5519)
MPVQGASKATAQAVTSWPAVTTHPRRYGGAEYRLGERREIGHIRGDAVVDVPIPIKLRDELIAAGRAEPHQLFPDLGAVRLFLRGRDDLPRAIELLRLSYDLAVELQSPGRPAAEL